MKIALIGYGKMGKAIEQIALQNGHEMVLKITGSNLSELTVQNISRADVAIEFSHPEAAYGNIMKCFGAGVPVVCGTTGWNDKLAEVKKICLEKNQAFFHAPNFSIGVNLFFSLNEQMAMMAKRFSDYHHITISETHHTQKKDAPSGTAVALANDIIRHHPGIRKWESKSGEAKLLMNTKETGILPVYSSRTGDVAGIHEVVYASDDDSISLVHEAKGRSGFAKGALMAAEWLVGKKGVFGMKDLLEL